MNKKPNRQHTFYTKDVLPENALQELNKPTLDLNQAVRDQSIVVRNCKESLKNIRKKLIMYMDQILSTHNVDKLAILEEDFLNKVLKSVQEEESELRSQLVGQQASVDMFKTAVGNNEVDDVYLEAERFKRNSLTRTLADIVKDRETVFAALENLQVLALNNAGADGILENIKAEYQEVESHLQSEQKKLKKFTEWQRNPGLMLRQTDPR